MKLTIHHHDHDYTCDTNQGQSLAISLDFAGPQPNFFGAATAAKQTLKMGDFVASTRSGSGCNVDTLSMVPHCNGTHTETVSHIVDARVPIGDALMDNPFVAVLISVPLTKAGLTKEVYRPPLAPHDDVITAVELKSALQAIDIERHRPAALIIRTLPNTNKKSKIYDDRQPSTFFTIAGMQAVVELGVDHLLVDTPSIDRMHDDGLLTNHHLFWNVPENSQTLTASAWPHKTITEMIHVGDSLADGLYLLNLQIPSFVNTDAAPSRPIVYPIHD